MKLAGRLFLALSALLFILSAIVFARTVDRRAAGGGDARGAAQEEAEPYPYIIRSDNGRVMLYPNNSGSGTAPVELAIRYADLPPEDRALLDEGITVEDERQLLSVMEDYTN